MLTANDCLPGVWVRVSGGRLCEAEAPTETAAVWLPKNANMALKIADIAYVLETGRITMTGSGKELLENPEIKAAYLGKKK